MIGEAGPAGDAIQAMIDLGLTTHDIKTAKAKPKGQTPETSSKVKPKNLDKIDDMFSNPKQFVRALT